MNCRGLRFAQKLAECIGSHAGDPLGTKSRGAPAVDRNGREDRINFMTGNMFLYPWQMGGVVLLPNVPCDWEIPGVGDFSVLLMNITFGKCNPEADYAIKISPHGFTPAACRKSVFERGYMTLTKH